MNPSIRKLVQLFEIECQPPSNLELRSFLERHAATLPLELRRELAEALIPFDLAARNRRGATANTLPEDKSAEDARGVSSYLAQITDNTALFTTPPRNYANDVRPPRADDSGFSNGKVVGTADGKHPDSAVVPNDEFSIAADHNATPEAASSHLFSSIGDADFAGHIEPGSRSTARVLGERFELRESLGSGAFGEVYRAYDRRLDRLFAVKLLNKDVLAAKVAKDLFLHEARIAARLDFPGLVRVYDVVVDATPPFIVQQLISGQHLKRWKETASRSHIQVAQLLLQVAIALQHMHEHGVFHRDLKPTNILVDETGQPWVTDFGLAVSTSMLRSEDVIRAGTLQYMSPEQLRNETHNLDGRTDLWSWGVILYELLAGQRPFCGSTQNALTKAILEDAPPAMRGITPPVPKELERVCLKCLEKSRLDRYLSAADLIDDLQAAIHTSMEQHAAATTLAAKEHAPVAIYCKGPRAFDEDDVEGYLQLLPGARDRYGLPESISFWKHRIEAADPHRQFRVGSLIGASGCGKSSLLRAGLLPRLSADIAYVYVQATSGPLDRQLFDNIMSIWRTRSTSVGDSLPAVLQHIREHGILPNRKLLIVIDQFEQWLANANQDGSAVTDALRQCDGGNLQCLIALRDDFYLEHCRFLRTLDIEFATGQNACSLELFDKDHATKVLKLFARGDGHEITSHTETFINEVVNVLATHNLVSSVQLSMFAFMMKGQEWIPENLDSYSPATGIGIVFLRQRLSAQRFAQHRSAIQGLLECLVADASHDLRASLRTYDDLLHASGYSHRAEDFADLLDAFVRELRLVTMVRPDQRDTTSDTRRYQLTHDYLVPAVRQWLNEYAPRSWRNRLSRSFRESAALYRAKPQTRFLPNPLETLAFQMTVSGRRRRDFEQAVILKAWRHYAFQVVVLALLVACGATYYTYRPNQLIQGLLHAPPEHVTQAIHDLAPHYERVEKALSSQAKTSMLPGNIATDSEFNALLAIARHNSNALYRVAQLLEYVSPRYIHAIRDCFSENDKAHVVVLQNVLHDSGKDAEFRLRAGVVLKCHANKLVLDVATADTLAHALSTNDPAQSVFRAADLSHMQPTLFSALARTMKTADAHAQRLNALKWMQIIDERGVEHEIKELLIWLVSDVNVDGNTFADVIDLLGTLRRDVCVEYLRANHLSTATIANRSDGPLGANYKKLVKASKSRALSAAALLRLESHVDALNLLHSDDDPHQAGIEADHAAQFLRLCVSHGITIRRLLAAWQTCDDQLLWSQQKKAFLTQVIILALGEHNLTKNDVAFGQATERVRTAFASHADSGVHGAARWTLQRWFNEGDVAERPTATVNLTPKNREWFTAEVTWPTSQGPLASQVTFVIIPAGKYAIRNYKSREMVPVDLPHAIAILDREITFAELVASDPSFGDMADRMENWIFATPETAATSMRWREAAAFCYWLRQRLLASRVSWVMNDEKGNQRPIDPAHFICRLPTAIEWEIAARSGAVTDYSFGRDSSLFQRYGWSMENSKSTESGKVEVHIPRRLRPNWWGVFDIHGNLSEWSEDFYFDPEKDDKAKEPEMYAGGDGRAIHAVMGGNVTVAYGESLCWWYKSGVPSTTSGDNDRHLQVGFRPVVVLDPTAIADRLMPGEEKLGAEWHALGH